ncbi:elongator complex protein 4-like [Plasmopara halstedii]|uniref:Elongator complex protein 4 n=1 Tax=Plasmopara halstedii TaxID=4781 RepID=A0A0P1AT91_PLAHL|nr:elongator complex protein 4-like [Plasmopara halstedii]CEG44434.1 elongator complex protein 4-like [Plasmopara halstedii]|eukprot:XP_024580803.1 elongator complex protein 4-like [Plasmopara halstedii]
MSFRRKTSTTSSSLRSGTKPFLNGQTLVSSGLSELDTALGGGLLLRTLNIVETSTLVEVETTFGLDLSCRASDALAIDLLRYFLAEGVADAKQRVALVAPDASGFFKEQLPLELSLAQKQVKEQLAHKEKKDAPLTIAWQYGKYNEKQSKCNPRFCHSFDLSKTMHHEMTSANEPIAFDLLGVLETNAVIGDTYDHLYLMLEGLIQQKEERDGQVLRIGMFGLGSPLLGPADAAHMTALFGFFRRLRALLCQSDDTVCLTVLASDVQSVFPAAFINELRHVADSVLTLKSFAGSRDLLPDELQEFQGSLTLKKLPRVYALACQPTSNARLGVKRDRRKLKFEKFHLPPEGSRSNSSHSSSCSITSSSTGGPDLLAF